MLSEREEALGTCWAPGSGAVAGGGVAACHPAVLARWSDLEQGCLCIIPRDWLLGSCTAMRVVTPAALCPWCEGGSFRKEQAGGHL